MLGASKSSSTSNFSGFTKPEQNWFKMPSSWTNITAQMSSLAEIKVVEYVLKHTWGYQEYGGKKRITNEEFMLGRKRKDGSRIDDGTGLSKPSVISGLKLAVQDGLLIEEVDNSDKARVKKYYALRMADGSESSSPRQTGPFEPRSATVNHLNAGVKNVNPKGKDQLPRSEKETKERKNNVNVDKNRLTSNTKSRQTERRPNRSTASGMASMAQVMGRYSQPSAEQHLDHTEDDEVLRRDYVANELARELDDEKGLGCFRAIAEKIPQQIVFEKLALVKELAAEGTIRSNPAALFVYYIKQYAKDKQIDLKFGSGS